MASSERDAFLSVQTTTVIGEVFVPFELREPGGVRAHSRGRASPARRPFDRPGLSRHIAFVFLGSGLEWLRWSSLGSYLEAPEPSPILSTVRIRIDEVRFAASVTEDEDDPSEGERGRVTSSLH